MGMSEERPAQDLPARVLGDGALHGKVDCSEVGMCIYLKASEVSAASTAAGRATAATAIHRIPHRWCLLESCGADGSRSLGIPSHLGIAEGVGSKRRDGMETRWPVFHAQACLHGQRLMLRTNRSWLAPRGGASVLRATCPSRIIGENYGKGGRHQGRSSDHLWTSSNGLHIMTENGA